MKLKTKQLFLKKETYMFPKQDKEQHKKTQ